MPTPTFYNLPEVKRRHFLDIAIDEFAAHDYNQASISRIVARAGIAKGSLYQYFADKRDLYFYLLELASAEKSAFFTAFPMDTAGDLFAYLRDMFRAGLGFEFSNPKLAQVAYRAVYGGGPQNEDALNYLRQNSADFFNSLIRDSMGRGETEPRLDPELVAFLLNQVLSGFGDFLLRRMELSPVVLAGGHTDEMDRPEYWGYIDQLLLILQHGLRPAA